MIVWGGRNGVIILDDGGRYNPGTDSSTATSTTNVSGARSKHTAVWTGGQMIVWAGIGDSYRKDTNSGGRYCATP